jgi:hypothetical protein
MSYKFSLTVTIDGDSLQSLDEQLVSCAGERLRARMVNPPKFNGADIMAPVVPTVSVHPAPAVPTVAVPTVAVPTVAVPTVAVPTVAVPTVAVPTVAVPTVAVPTVAVHSAGQTPEIPVKRKPGRPPGRPKKEVNHAPSENQQPQETQPHEQERHQAPHENRQPPVGHENQQPYVEQTGSEADEIGDAASDPVVSAHKPASIADAITALKLVNSRHNVDRARECLAKFGVAKCGELTDDNRHLFVAHCESICV